MSELVSTATMIKRLEGLLGTKDITQWEQGFIESIVAKDDPTSLTGKQVDAMARIYSKHFA